MTKNKKILNYLEMLENNPSRSIYDVYAKPSNAKVNAYIDCLKKYFIKRDDGEIEILKYSVLGFNTSTFTFGVLINDKKTNERLLCIETHANTYTYKI